MTRLDCAGRTIRGIIDSRPTPSPHTYGGYDMALRFLVCGLMLVGFGAATRGDEKPAKAATHAGFERLKKMAGTWVEADKDGKPTDKVVSVVKVTAAGSTVQETLFPGTQMEMMSVYHMDKSDLVMTHYCMLGNQPRMKA